MDEITTAPDKIADRALVQAFAELAQITVNTDPPEQALRRVAEPVIEYGSRWVRSWRSWRGMRQELKPGMGSSQVARMFSTWSCEPSLSG